MKRHYTIVSCNSDTLQNKVEALIQKGWHPLGGLAATPNGCLHQSMYSARARTAESEAIAELVADEPELVADEPKKQPRWWPFS